MAAARRRLRLGPHDDDVLQDAQLHPGDDLGVAFLEQPCDGLDVISVATGAGDMGRDLLEQCHCAILLS